MLLQTEHQNTERYDKTADVELSSDIYMETDDTHIKTLSTASRGNCPIIDKEVKAIRPCKDVKVNRKLNDAIEVQTSHYSTTNSSINLAGIVNQCSNDPARAFSNNDFNLFATQDENNESVDRNNGNATTKELPTIKSSKKELSDSTFSVEDNKTYKSTKKRNDGLAVNNNATKFTPSCVIIGTVKQKSDVIHTAHDCDRRPIIDAKKAKKADNRDSEIGTVIPIQSVCGPFVGVNTDLNINWTKLKPSSHNDTSGQRNEVNHDKQLYLESVENLEKRPCAKVYVTPVNKKVNACIVDETNEMEMVHVERGMSCHNHATALQKDVNLTVNHTEKFVFKMTVESSAKQNYDEHIHSKFKSSPTMMHCVKVFMLELCSRKKLTTADAGQSACNQTTGKMVKVKEVMIRTISYAHNVISASFMIHNISNDSQTFFVEFHCCTLPKLPIAKCFEAIANGLMHTAHAVYDEVSGKMNFCLGIQDQPRQTNETNNQSEINYVNHHIINTEQKHSSVRNNDILIPIEFVSDRRSQKKISSHDHITTKWNDVDHGRQLSITLEMGIFRSTYDNEMDIQSEFVCVKNQDTRVKSRNVSHVQGVFLVSLVTKCEKMSKYRNSHNTIPIEFVIIKLSQKNKSRCPNIQTVEDNDTYKSNEKWKPTVERDSGCTFIPRKDKYSSYDRTTTKRNDGVAVNDNTTEFTERCVVMGTIDKKSDAIHTVLDSVKTDIIKVNKENITDINDYEVETVKMIQPVDVNKEKKTIRLTLKPSNHGDITIKRKDVEHNRIWAITLAKGECKATIVNDIDIQPDSGCVKTNVPPIKQTLETLTCLNNDSIKLNSSMLLFPVCRSFTQIGGANQSRLLRDLMNNETNRLVSFNGYLGNGNTLSLAKEGFYHDAQNGPTSTVCYFCHVMRDNWQPRDNITVEHHRECPLDILPSNNIPIGRTNHQIRASRNGRIDIQHEAGNNDSSNGATNSQLFVRRLNLPGQFENLSGNRHERLPIPNLIRRNGIRLPDVARLPMLTRDLNSRSHDRHHDPIVDLRHRVIDLGGFNQDLNSEWIRRGPVFPLFQRVDDNAAINRFNCQVVQGAMSPEDSERTHVPDSYDNSCQKCRFRPAVIQPCGHSVCCIECQASMHTCPQCLFR